MMHSPACVRRLLNQMVTNGPRRDESVRLRFLWFCRPSNCSWCVNGCFRALSSLHNLPIQSYAYILLCTRAVWFYRYNNAFFPLRFSWEKLVFSFWKLPVFLLERGRMRDSQSSEPRFESPFATFSKFGHFRSLHWRPSWLSYVNEYLAVVEIWVI